MPVNTVGSSVAPVRDIIRKSDTKTQEDVNTLEKKDNSRLLYGSLTALALLGVGCVAYRAFKGKGSSKDVENIPEYIKAPVVDEATKNTADKIVSVVAQAVETLKREKAFKEFKKGLAYNGKGELFTGERELVGWGNRKMVTTYKDGKVVKRMYFPTKQNDLMEVNCLYDESVEGIKMIDKALVQRNLDHKVTFEIIEKETKFPEEIEKVIPKSIFDRPFDAGFYSQFHSENNGMAITWKLNDSIEVFGTGLSERGPRKMSLHYKGSHIRDFIDTPLGNIKGFRNKDAYLSIHTNIGHNELKVHPLKELGETSYKGRSLDDVAADLTERYMNGNKK